MRKTTVEIDDHGTRLRVHGGCADGWPQPDMASVMCVGGGGRELVTVARRARVEGADVVSRVVENLPGRVFERMVEKSLIKRTARRGWR